MSDINDKGDWKHWKKGFPYKGGITNPQYKKDKDAMFKKHGNGWWYGWHLVKPDKRPIDMWNGKKFKTNEEI